MIYLEGRVFVGAGVRMNKNLKSCFLSYDDVPAKDRFKISEFSESSMFFTK